jgi:site-specific DNA recombinase
VTPSRAAIYVRISKDALALGLGVERQEHLCRKFAEAHGWTVAKVYRDNDVSAFSGAPRPAYSQLLHDLEHRIADGLLAVDVDRLTRDPRNLEDLIDLAADGNIPIKTQSGDLDLTTSDGRLKARIMVTVARQESEKKSERIKRQKEYARAKGWWTSPPPYGYRLGDSGDGGKRLIPEPDEARVVREIARRLLDGETLLSTALWASRETGKPWAPVQTTRVVTRPTAAGWQPHGDQLYRHPETGQPVPVTDDPLLDEVTWHRIRAMFDGRRQTGVSGRSSEILLARLVFCDRCGTVMSHVRDTRKRSGSRYYCRTKHHGGGGCVGNTASSVRVDGQVDDYIAARLDELSVGGLPDLDEQPDLTEVNRLSGLLASQERERSRLLMSGASPERIEAVSRTLDEVDRALTDARRSVERERRTVDLSSLDGLVSDVYRSMPVPDRRRVIGLLIDRVRICPAGGRTSVWDPGRVHIDPVG